ncbi:MAG: TIR domain-containing protein [Planctomycetota bacterium]|nr:TIR domain-containing protein [Planctomycetota bacterium]
MHDAAISYSRKDSDALKAIVKHDAGIDWWFDCGEEDSIPRGHPDWYHSVEESITDSAVLLVLLSDRWTKSEICLKETRFAIGLGKRIIIAVHPDHPPNTPVDRIFRSPQEGWPEAPDVREAVEKTNWVWIGSHESPADAVEKIAEIIRTDFEWLEEHVWLTRRAREWKTTGEPPGGLLRGKELRRGLVCIAGVSEKDERNIEDLQQTFVLESQEREAERTEKLESLYRESLVRQLALTALDRVEEEPDVALLLAAASVEIESTTRSDAALLSCLARHSTLVRMDFDHDGGVNALAFSPDGRWLASGDHPRAVNVHEGRLRIREVSTGRIERTLPVEGGVNALAWGRSREWLAIANGTSIGWLRWDEEKWKFRGNTVLGLPFNQVVDHIDFSPSGDWLLAGDIYGEAALVRVGDHSVQPFEAVGGGTSEALRAFVWLSDEEILTVEDGTVRVRSRDSFEELATVAEYEGFHAADARGCEWVLLMRKGTAIKLVRGRGEKVLDELATPDDHLIRAVALDEAPSRVFVGGGGGKTNLPCLSAWTLPAMGRESVYQGFATHVTSLALGPDGRHLAAGDFDGRVMLFDVNHPGHLVERLPREGRVATVAASEAAGLVAIAYCDGGIEFTDPDFRVEVDDSPLTMAFAEGGKFLLVTGAAGALFVVDVETRTVTGRMELPPPESGTGWHQLAAGDGGPWFAVVTSGERVTVGRIEADGTPVSIALDELPAEPRSVAVDAATGWLYVAHSRLNLQIHAFDLTGGSREPPPIDAPGGAFIGTAPMIFAAGRLLVASQDNDADEFLIDVEGAEEPVTYAGHTEPVSRFASAPDGERFVSISLNFEDQDCDEICYWHFGEPRAIATIRLPAHASSATFRPDGRGLLIGDREGQLWNVVLDPERWVAIARDIVRRDLSETELRTYGLAGWREEMGAASAL